MKSNKTQVMKVEILENENMLVKLASRQERDAYLAVIEAIAPPGSVFERVGDTDLLCKIRD